MSATEKPATDANPAAADRNPAARKTPAADGNPAARKTSARGVWITGLLAALLLAGGLSYYASASPDGLEKVAADHGIDRTSREHAARNSPLADYRTKDVENSRLSGGLAGVIGVGATLALGTGVFRLLRRRASASPDGG